MDVVNPLKRVDNNPAKELQIVFVTNFDGKKQQFMLKRESRLCDLK